MKFFAVLAAILLAASAVVAQTNISAVVTNDILANGYLQIQEQLHATRLEFDLKK